MQASKDAIIDQNKALSEMERLLAIIRDERQCHNPNEEIITNCLNGIGDCIKYLHTSKGFYDEMA